MNILVLDVGTSSMRGTLLDQDAERLSSVRVSCRPEAADGRVEQAPQTWVDAMDSICRQLAGRYPVDAVAITAQRSSVIPLDREGRPLTNAVMWQDTRNMELCSALRAHEETVRAISGTGINTVFSGGKMAWLRAYRPELYHRAAHLCVVPDYLIYHMTGVLVTDHTYGSRSMLMDLRRGAWSPELLDIFGVDERKLCRLIPTCSIAGTVSELFSARTGLPAGIPVITCGGDQQCGAVGQGVIGPGRVSVNFGTGAYLIAAADRVPEVLPGGMLCNASAIPGQYILESSVLTCGAALDWYLDLVGEADVSAVGKALRTSPPGANGVMALPWFQGRSCPEWNGAARGAFMGLSLAATREDLLRALLEGICGEIGSSLRMLAQAGPIDTVCLSGGLSGTDEVCQLLADMTGVTVSCRDGGDATTRGAWMSAAVCLKLVPGWDEAWETVRGADPKRFEPDARLTAYYQDWQEKRERLGRNVEDICWKN